jgi:NAD(P)-dependent dehydrogenase (short-subunit alcohol dehydrogenase family)
MSQQLGGRTPLITGGGSGIGRATALALADEGCTITVAGRTIAATLQETVRQVEAAGGTGPTRTRSARGRRLHRPLTQPEKEAECYDSNRERTRSDRHPRR